jgi:integrase
MILDEELDRLSRQLIQIATAMGDKGLDEEDIQDIRGQYGRAALLCATNPFKKYTLPYGQELIDNAVSGSGDDSAQLIRELIHGLDDVGMTALRQAVIKARGVAYAAVAHDEQLLPVTREQAHKELDDFFPRSVINNLIPVTTISQQQTNSLSADIESIARVTGLPIIKQVTLREAIDKFIESKNSSKERSLKNKRLALQEFELAIGENTITREIDLVTIERFVKLVHNFPNRRGKQSLRPDIWSYIDSPEAGPKLSKGTVRTKLAQVKTLLHDMKRRGFIAGAVVDSACYAIGESSKGNSEDLGRLPFEFSHLETLFDPEKYLPYTSLHGDDFWIPLLGLFTGARLREIVRLQRRDIKCTPDQPYKTKRRDNSRSGIWFIDWTVTGKDLKNDTSNRVVPLHPYLFDIGFGKYISDFKPDEFIFPHYGLQDRDKSSDFFLRYRRKVGVGRQEGETDTGMLDFHSFRHTVLYAFKDELVLDMVSREIAGHTIGNNKDVHSQHYEGRYSIETLCDKGTMALDIFVDNIESLGKIKSLAGTDLAPWTLEEKVRPVYRTKGKRRSFEYPFKPSHGG